MTQTIAILGWGSLIWRPEKLSTIGDWSMEGPVLPIEFSRISEKGRLTLVIDEKNGVPLRTRFILSGCASLDDAIENLREREGAPTARGIGYVDARNGSTSPQALRNHPNATERVSAWAREHDLDAVIWTAIGPRYPIGPAFSPEGAVAYLRSLQGPLRAEAFEYVRNAPAELATPVRKLFQAEFG